LTWPPTSDGTWVSSETGATSMKEMGRVMGLVTQRGGGRVDGRAASALVRARLGA